MIIAVLILVSCYEVSQGTTERSHNVTPSSTRVKVRKVLYGVTLVSLVLYIIYAFMFMQSMNSQLQKVLDKVRYIDYTKYIK